MMNTTMKRIPDCPDVLTRKGRAALAENLRLWSMDPEFLDGVEIGPFKLHGGLSLSRAADRITANGYHRVERPGTSLPDDIHKFDAVRYYGTPEAGLAAIRRQLGIQSGDMDPADVKRCERAAGMLEHHIWKEAEAAWKKAEAEAEAACFDASTKADPKNPPPAGTEVYVTPHGYTYKGTVTGSAMKRDRILGKKIPHVEVQLTHKRETVGRLWAFWRKPKLRKLWFPCREILIPIAP